MRDPTRAVTFSHVAAKTQRLVLIVDDPDVPETLMPTGVFDPQLTWDLPADSKGIFSGCR